MEVPSTADFLAATQSLVPRSEESYFPLKLRTSTPHHLNTLLVAPQYDERDVLEFMSQALYQNTVLHIDPGQFEEPLTGNVVNDSKIVVDGIIKKAAQTGHVLYRKSKSSGKNGLQSRA